MNAVTKTGFLFELGRRTLRGINALNLDQPRIVRHVAIGIAGSGLIDARLGGPKREKARRSEPFHDPNLRLDGVPTGIRTPVATVKGLCPRPLDDGDMKRWWS